MVLSKPPGNYGVDAPYVPLLSAAAGAAFLALGIVSASLFPLLTAVVLLAQAVIYLHTTRRGKFVAWARVLDNLADAAPATTLDVGCGRGMVASANRAGWLSRFFNSAWYPY